MPTRLLVVDDEPDLELLIRQKFRRRVRSGEMDFVFAGDGVEALAALEAHPDIAVVLTDINMPRMDGLTLLDRIGDLDRLIKVVIVSAYGDMSNIRTAMNRGAFDFIIKPIDFTDLEVTVDKTIREVEALREATILRTQLDSLQHELDLARQIQLSSLPARFPAFPDRSDFDLYATMLPAREVGGDFYDFFLVDDDRLGFVLGDVSGKGMGAALFMAVTRTMVRATALRDLPVETCVRHANRVLHPESLPRMFVTLIYGMLDTRTGEIAYCNAGHNLPYVVRASGEVALVSRTSGIGLCLAKDFNYEAGALTLHPGDSLFLYTDGVTEAVNEYNERFEEERLERCLCASCGQPAEAMIRQVLHTVEVFAGSTAQADDLTMLALQYRGR
jgi:sigma-B regulation protein RsbU (phosphoserine phosphatase)